MNPPAAPGHLRHLDGLRALAALYVLLCHAFLQVSFRGHPVSDLARSILQVFFYGHYAVDLFIVLSGFCLMLPIVRGDGTLRGGAWNFFKRRAWRILPAYYCAVALSLLLIWSLIGQKTGTHWDISIPATSKGVWTHLILMQDALGEEASINHVLWSIAVEWRIYFLFPLLVWSWARWGSAVTAALAIVLSCLVFQWCQAHLGTTLASHYVGLFAMGMLGANVAFPSDGASRFLSRAPWPLLGLFLSLIVYLMFFPAVWDGPRVRVYVADYVVGLWSMTMLVAVSRNEHSWLARGLGWKPLAFVGTFAYSIYLIHAPLLQVLWQYVFTGLHASPFLMLAALMLVGMPAIVGVSYLFYLAFERPFVRTKVQVNSFSAEAILQPAV